MKATNMVLVATILGSLITEDKLGRVNDTRREFDASGMVRFLASSSEPEAQEQVRNILYGMHKRRLIDLTLDSNGELSTVCICPAGINLYRQLEVC